MKLMITLCLLSLMALPVIAQPRSDVFENYQNCLLKATRSGVVNTPDDVRKTEQHCRARFPDTAPPLTQQPLASDLRDKVEITTANIDQNVISGRIYNGNSNYTVTEVSVLMTPVQTGNLKDDFFQSETFDVRLNLAPNEAAKFELSPASSKLVGDVFNVKWTLIKVNGY